MRKSLMIVVMMALTLCAWVIPSRVLAEEKDEGKEGPEVRVKFDQVPAAAQKTLTEEAKGAKIDEVDKEAGDAKTIYEADVKLNDKNYEIKVAEDGTLISKRLDMEDEKGGKKDEKDEKDEKK